MFKTKQNNDKNTKGVKLAIWLELLMCVVAMSEGYALWQVRHWQQERARESRERLIKRLFLILCFWFSIPSCVAVLSGFGYFCGSTSCLKVFGVTSMGASVVFILFIICAMGTFIFWCFLDIIHEPDEAVSVVVACIFFVGLAIMRVYCHIKTQKCIKKSQETQDSTSNRCCVCLSTSTGVVLTIFYEAMILLLMGGTDTSGLITVCINASWVVVMSGAIAFW
eukprot:959741_1